MSKRIQVYRTEAIRVTFDPNVCIHSAECLRGEPNVFDVKRPRWIRPELASPEKVAEVIGRCSSGALRYVRKDEGASRPAPGASVTIRPPPPEKTRRERTPES